MSTSHAVGSLVRARGREWVVLPGTTSDFMLLQPLGGGSADVAGVFPDEGVEAATFPIPTLDDLGDSTSTALLRTALRVGFTSSAGPFRSLAGISVSPRSYQYVPLLMALRQDVVRLLIADDVGIGKTVEAGLIAVELLAQGSAQRMAVLCSPALAEQWQRELSTKFGIDAVLLLTSTVKSLERGLMMNESLFDRYPHVIVSTDFIKSDRRRHEFLLRCPELVIVDEAHNNVAGSGIGQRGRHQRYELLRELAADKSRHLILATATPHSGDDEAFANLVGLLHPDLGTADLTSTKGRELLAGHFVQRRRGDIRRYLDEDTPFPKTDSPSTWRTACRRPTATCSTTSSPTRATRSSKTPAVPRLGCAGGPSWRCSAHWPPALAPPRPPCAPAPPTAKPPPSPRPTSSAARPFSTRATTSRSRGWTLPPAPWWRPTLRWGPT